MLKNVFSDVIEQVGYLSNIVKTLDINVLQNQDAVDRINFLCENVLGEGIHGNKVDTFWDGSDFENYEKEVESKVVALKRDYLNLIDKVIKNTFEKNLVVQMNKDKFSEGKLDKQFEGDKKDIGFASSQFLGINSGNNVDVTDFFNQYRIL